MPGLLLDPYVSFPGAGGLGPFVPTGHTLGAHRYWRIFMTNNHGGGFLAIAEVEMRATFGGADQCSGGTASASAATDGAAANAFANDGTASFWATNTATNQWLKYDFGSAKDIREVSIQIPSFATSNSPKDILIQWSDDDSAWTTGLSCSVSVDDWGGASGIKLFCIPVVSYRLNVTADVSSGNPAVATFAIAQTAGGSDETQVANAGHATGTTEVFAFSEYAFDGNVATSAQSSGTNVGTFEYHFRTLVNFAEAKLTVHAVNSSNPKTFTFQVSEDGGVTWTNILSPGDVTVWVADTAQTFTR